MEGTGAATVDGSGIGEWGRLDEVEGSRLVGAGWVDPVGCGSGPKRNSSCLVK